MGSLVEPNAWVCLRLPSDSLRVLQIVPNTAVSLGKYGTFSANLIIHRPYHLTYELLDRRPNEKDSRLRIVPASELHADTIAEEAAANGTNGPEDKITIGGDGVEFQLVGENGEVIMRSNRETIDDSARQTLTMEEIEELKKEGAGAGKDIIAKLMASHLGIEQKTAFSLAKYKLLKTKKYLRQFEVLPLDVPMLTHWMMEEKDFAKVLEIREEMLALVGSWANVHYAEELKSVQIPTTSGEETEGEPSTEVPTVSEVFAKAEVQFGEHGDLMDSTPTKPLPTSTVAAEEPIPPIPSTTSTPQLPSLPEPTPGGRYLVVDETGGLIVAALAERMGILHPPSSPPDPSSPESTQKHYEPPLATSNTITLIHQNAQPNLSLLKHFHFDPSLPNPTHPLSTHLHMLSWLQLLSPSHDTTYSTPVPPLSPTTLSTLKSGRRGTYYRKLRRHNKTREIVDSTRLGGFDSLIIASTMDPLSLLSPLLPLLRGGAQISIYTPTIEPLLLLSDALSTSRRTAFITSPPPSFLALQKEEREEEWRGDEDFPLNPTLVVGMSVQSSRGRKWQVLQGRTHPVMTGRGGAEGYLFSGTRVVPVRGRVEARGKFGRKVVKSVVVPIGAEEESSMGTPVQGQGNGEEMDVDVDIVEEGTGSDTAVNRKRKSEDREDEELEADEGKAKRVKGGEDGVFPS